MFTTNGSYFTDRMSLRWIARRRRFFPSFFVVASITIFYLWYCGLFDRLWERSFSTFAWPREFDLKTEVSREVEGLPPTVQYLNDPAEWQKQVVVDPPCIESPTDGAITLLIVVKSATQNILNRDAIRATWGWNGFRDGVDFRTIFVVGHNPLMAGSEVREAHAKNDVLALSFLDSYFNNTIKLVHSLNWATKCNTSFVLFVDDDYVLSPHKIIELVKARDAKQDLYEGWRFYSSPFRTTWAKHHVSLEEWPWDSYPPYITAGCVLTTRSTLSKFAVAARHTELFRMDDVYTGMLAWRIGIEPRHNEWMPYWRSTWQKEFVAQHGYSDQEIRDEYARVTRL